MIIEKITKMWKSGYSQRENQKGGENKSEIRHKLYKWQNWHEGQQ